jgi:aminopeptidase N
MQDYKPTPYLIEHVHLYFLLDEDRSTVKSKLHMTPNYGGATTPPTLELDGAAPAVHVSAHIPSKKIQS